jgi:Mg-chelatase subunit ChlI
MLFWARRAGEEPAHADARGFLDEAIPYLDIPGCPVHEDPYAPITSQGKRFLAARHGDDAPIAWWPREQRYAERLAPGTKFADIIGEIDPAKILGMDASVIRTRWSIQARASGSEEALHFGLIPRMHRGLFAMNELPDLDDLVQVGLFNILEERDVQIRGYPVSFDIDVMVLFSANPRPTTARARSSRSSRTASARRSRRTTPRSREAAHRDHRAGGPQGTGSTWAASGPTPSSCRCS